MKRVRPELASDSPTVSRLVRTFYCEAARLAAAEGTGLDDARHEIAILVMEALKLYDPSGAPIKQWAKLYVKRKVAGRIRDLHAQRRCPFEWEFDPEWGWTRRRARPIAADGIVEEVEASLDARPTETPEQAVLRVERADRFRDAVREAEDGLLAESPGIGGEIAVRVLRARLRDAVDTGTGRRGDLRAVLAELGLTRRQESYYWRKGKDRLRAALERAGELPCAHASNRESSNTAHTPARRGPE